jgi:thymidylate kinase
VETSDSLPQPDVYILLDGDEADAKVRAASRTGKADRFDVDMGKQQRVAHAYRALWNGYRGDPAWQVVDAKGSVEEVAERVQKACLLAQAG